MAAHLVEGFTSMFEAYGGWRGWCNKGNRFGEKTLWTCCCCEYAVKSAQCCCACVLCANLLFRLCGATCCDERRDRYLAKRMTVDEVARRVKTGDIILFSSSNMLTQLGTGSLWTHVNMIYKPSRSSIPFCFEVTLHRWVPTKNKGGAQMVPFREKISTYDKGGRFAWRKLRHGRMTRERKAILKAFMDEIENRPYQRDQTELMQAGLCYGNSYDTPADYFCSEAVAEAYKRLGFLAPDIPANRYAPADFSTEKRVGQGLRLLNGARLSPEVEILRQEDAAAIAQSQAARHMFNEGMRSAKQKGARAIVSAASAVLAVAVPGMITYRGQTDLAPATSEHEYPYSDDAQHACAQGGAVQPLVWSLGGAAGAAETAGAAGAAGVGAGVSGGAGDGSSSCCSSNGGSGSDSRYSSALDSLPSERIVDFSAESDSLSSSLTAYSDSDDDSVLFSSQE